MESDPPAAHLFEAIFADAQIAAVFDDRATLAGLLRFEADLAKAQAQSGLFDPGIAATIAGACRPELYDRSALAQAAIEAGVLAAPVVAALTAEVAQLDPEAAKWVHFGATSQDAVDSGLLDQIAAARAILDARLARLARALAALARAHRDAVMIGRTLMRQATPITFGLKAATWLSPLIGSRRAFDALVLPVAQFGGAVGALSALGENALPVARALVRLRGGSDWETPWHVDRGALLRLGAELAILVATLGRIATDIVLMGQTEIGEAFEPAAEGRGVSSTMPHKRNPVLATTILACASRAPGLLATLAQSATHAHERAVGGWQAEAPTLAALFGVTGVALARAVTLIEGIEIDAARMRANCDVTGGLVLTERIAMALTPTLGRARAKTLLTEASRQVAATGEPLRAILAQDAALSGALSPETLEALLDPAGYVGVSGAIVDRVVAEAAAVFDFSPQT